MIETEKFPTAGQDVSELVARLRDGWRIDATICQRTSGNRSHWCAPAVALGSPESSRVKE